MTNKFSKGELQVITETGLATVEEIKALAVMQLAAMDSEPVAWIYEDELPESYPYDAMFPYSKVDIVRMFPVFAPPAPVAVPDVGEFRIFTQAGGVKVAVKDGKTKNHLFGMGWNACRAAILKAGPVTAPEQEV